jgi:Ankyrin repeats (3 copies)
MRNDVQEVKRLLEAGADPNEGRFLGAPPIFLALMRHNREMAGAMMARGADVTATDGSGATTLMWAAYDEHADPTLVRELLAKGVDPNAKNKAGETALLWAMRRGNTPVVEALMQAGASGREMVKPAVEKAVALLLKTGPQFVRVSGCTSCHNQSLPQMAYSTARARGFAVDEKSARYQVDAVVATFKPLVPDMMAGKPNVPDPAISVSYALVGLAAEGYAPDRTTGAMAHLVSLQQTGDGSFLAFPARPPIESSVFTATALSVRALQVYGKDVDHAVERARNWLERAQPQTTEDRAMQLLGLRWTKADRKAIESAAGRLLAEQRADGGWGQLTTLESDAYATGQALAALRISGQLQPSDAAWQKGAGFLLRTQLEDGSWLVRSRTFPFQPYKESGFPHGKNQWISAAGSSWAVLALSLGEQPQIETSML